jgi:serine/threonine protein phosphatase PrpC
MTKVDQAGISDIGLVRGKNEDCLGHHIPDDPAVLARKGQIFIVADGVGGYGAGDVASSEGVRELINFYYASSKRPDKALRGAINQINLHIFDLAIQTNHHRMQTTLSAIVIVGKTFHIVHVGDTRIYKARLNTEIEQLTTDHSEVAELVRMKILSPDKVRNHERRSIITKSVGAETVVRPMYRTGEVRPGDHFVMLTDGAWEPVEDPEIGQIVTRSSPDEACREIVRLALERDTRDNLSVQVVKVLEVSEEHAPIESSLARWIDQIRKLFHREEVL